MSLNRVRVAVLSLALLGLLQLGCGGSSKSATDLMALCNQGCDKTIPLCAASAGIPTAQIQAAVSVCKSECVSQATMATTCTNAAAIVSASQQCLTKNTCDELTACTTGIPQCAGQTGGTGGKGGTGGSGTGGTSGSAGGATGSGGAAAGSGGAPSSGGSGVGGSSSSGAGGSGLIGFDGGIPGFDGSIPSFDGSFSLDALAGSGTCADLQACCNAVADATTKAQCTSAYDAAKTLGDSYCGAVYSGFKQAGTCP